MYPTKTEKKNVKVTFCSRRTHITFPLSAHFMSGRNSKVPPSVECNAVEKCW